MRWRGLLVSVRDATEAMAALDGGAAIIDVKNPAAGSLGAAAARDVAGVARAVGLRHRVPWTVAAGELRDELHDPGRTLRWLDRIVAESAAAAAADATPHAIKFGLAGLGGTAWQRDFCRVMQSLPGAMARVAVAYADWPQVNAPPPLDIVAAAAEAGCSVFLVDTADKSAPGLLEANAAPALDAWIEAARGAGLAVALGGRLRLDAIPSLGRFAPDVVAVRSAVCLNGRVGPVDASLVRCAATAVDHLETAARATPRSSCAPLPGA
jgi:uncharacterized protein (UPF0264 family)